MFADDSNQEEIGTAMHGSRTSLFLLGLCLCLEAIFITIYWDENFNPPLPLPTTSSTHPALKSFTITRKNPDLDDNLSVQSETECLSAAARTQRYQLPNPLPARQPFCPLDEYEMVSWNGQEVVSWTQQGIRYMQCSQASPHF
ncbi:hypothetical protein TWF694_010873 [Orbilia ellipsospora]|uniref:Uncharacterized protein n=1 Tax=Orbilia ellipsospora TaxID=2528407 RepID=A0AAV9X7C1_9PEZI